jgi:hypothetical protein
MNRQDEVQLLSQYYFDQALQNGSGGVYQGVLYQRGHGIGSFLSGLFRMVLPMLKQTGSAVGRELLKNASNVLADTDNNISFGDSLKTRGLQSVANAGRRLFSEMSGSGYNTNQLGIPVPHSTSGRKRRKTSSKRKKKTSKPKAKKVPRKKTSKKSKSTNLFAKRLTYF